jgi:hypothetical protein
MIYDLTQWFAMPSTLEGQTIAPGGAVYGRETHHLEGLKFDGTAAEKLYHVDTGYSLKFIKSQQGWPVEIKPYDSQFIYDRTTENGWTSPRDFKQFNPQLAMCPRWWDGVSLGPTHLVSPFEFWKNCALVSKSDYGQVKHDIIGPYPINFDGDIGTVPSIIIRYFGNGNGNIFSDREELYLTQRAGWCKWTHAKLVGGAYQIDDGTLHNRIILGGPPPIQFPCVTIP